MSPPHVPCLQPCDKHEHSWHCSPHSITSLRPEQPWLFPDGDGAIISAMFNESAQTALELFSTRNMTLLDSSADSNLPECSKPVSSRKNQSNKIDFFDLPAELRVQIYKHICTATYLAFSPPTKSARVEASASDELSLPAGFAHLEAWSAYSKALKDLQLTTHRFRAEFLPVWAEVMTFQLTLSQPFWRRSKGSTRYHSNKNKQVWRDSLITDETLAHRIWTRLRDFLHDHETRLGIAKYIRHIQVLCTYDNISKYNSPTAELYAPFVRHFRGHDIARHMEMLDSVHPELSVAVQLVCTTLKFAYTDKYPAVPRARRTLRLRQRTCVDRGKVNGTREAAGQQWVCAEEGALQVRKMRHCAQHGNWLPSRWSDSVEEEEEGSGIVVVAPASSPSEEKCCEGEEGEDPCPSRPRGSQSECERREEQRRNLYYTAYASAFLMGR